MAFTVTLKFEERDEHVELEASTGPVPVPMIFTLDKERFDFIGRCLKAALGDLSNVLHGVLTDGLDSVSPFLD